MKHWVPSFVFYVSLVATAWGTPNPALGDTLNSRNEGAGAFGSYAQDDYEGIEELAYEAIIIPDNNYRAQLHLRLTLHNSSQDRRDAVMSVALPKRSQIEGFAVGRNGVWEEGQASSIASESGRREPGSVYLKPLPPEKQGDLPGAQLALFGFEAGTTTQIEIRCRIYPRAMGDKWQITLPRRENSYPHMSSDRRVIVKGLQAGDDFEVAGIRSGQSPLVISSFRDTVDLSWPNRNTSSSSKSRHLKKGLGGNLEVLPNPDGNGGQFRLVMQWQAKHPITPDHVIFVVDHSSSTRPQLGNDAIKLVEEFGKQLPNATVDVLTFSRDVHPVWPASRLHFSELQQQPILQDEMRRALRPTSRQDGSDLRPAFETVKNRLAQRKAKQPLVVVITDGSLPKSLASDEQAKQWNEDFASAVFSESNARNKKSKKHSPAQLLFVVDDPLVARYGLGPDQAISTLSQKLGAKLIVENLAGTSKDTNPVQDTNTLTRVEQLLSSPPPLQELQLRFRGKGRSQRAEIKPRNPLPPLMIAGQTTIIEGDFKGPAPRLVQLRGKSQVGGKERSIRVAIQASRRSVAPSAWATTGTTGGTTADYQTQSASDNGTPDPIEEGFATPQWFGHKARRLHQHAITRAGKGNFEAVGRLDGPLIQRYLHTRVRPRVQACFNRGLIEHPDQSGRIEIEIEMGKGEITLSKIHQAKLKYEDSEMLSCVEEAGWKLGIPAGQLDSRQYRIRYPLTLNPPAGSRAPQISEETTPVLEYILNRADLLSR